MNWQCPNHKTFVYFAPGRCLLCQQLLQPVEPIKAKRLKALVSDPKTLTATLEVANTLLRRLLR